jgi:hypothetical protein
MGETFEIAQMQNNRAQMLARNRQKGEIRPLLGELAEREECFESVVKCAHHHYQL